MTIDAAQSTRDRRRLRTRRELAASAVRLFEERGFAETTVEDIAETADYSASTFFRLFTRKEDAVFFDMPDRLDALRSDLHVANDEPFWPALRAALIQHARTWEQDDPTFAASRVRLFHREPALAARYLEYCQGYEALIAELVARNRGTDPDHDIAAQLAGICIVAGLRTAFRIQASAPDPSNGDSVVAYLEHAFDVLESGPLSAITN